MADRMTLVQRVDRNDKRKKNNTIRHQIRQLVVYIVFFMLGIVTLIVLWGVMNHREMDALSDQYLSIGSFLEEVKNTDSALKTYTYSSEKEDYQSLLQMEKEMEEGAARLSSMEIMNTSTRQVMDIQHLLYSFSLLLEQMDLYREKNVSNSADTVWLVRSSEEYQNSLKVLEYMEEEGSRLYTNAQTAIIALRKQMKAAEKIYLVLVFLASVTLLVIGVLRTKKLEKSITEPVMRLTDSAQNIITDDIERSEPIGNKETESDEIIVLTRVFNQMLKKLQKQVKELRQTAYLKESEVKRLQSQINSHFLFNTLSMISQTAYLEDADRTVELMQATAKFLRYSLDSTDKKVTLSKELEELGNYIYLQEQRFGDRIHFYFELKEQYHDVRVPSLILQPLIENAISHGIGMKKRGGTVWISTGYNTQDKQVIIRIRDNGEGIEPDKLRKLKENLSEAVEGINEKPEQRIGIKNIYKRLKLCYGENARLSIDSRAGAETVVEIGIPYAGR